MCGASIVCTLTELRSPLKDAGKKNGKLAGARTDSKGKNNGSAYDGEDEEGNLGACDVFVAPDGEVTQASLHSTVMVLVLGHDCITKSSDTNNTAAVVKGLLVTICKSEQLECMPAPGNANASVYTSV